MDQITELIYNKITQSAINKFDLNEFEDDFLTDLDNFEIVDNIVFNIIVHFAAGNKNSEIITFLSNEMLLLGFEWNKTAIEKILIGKKELFKLEIYLTQLSNDMLENGTNPIAVLETIEKLID